MGIPSYYKRLCDRIKGLVNSTKPVQQIHWLWVDFNCMIYHCLQREDTPPYPENANVNDLIKKKWEDNFIYSVECYLDKVIKKVNPTQGVFVGVDGVVPLAKMKQQRMRRFKSAWERENSVGTGAKTVSWDKNAITPGTDFMNRLCRHIGNGRLTKMGAVQFLFSGVQESGEGEHKIMDIWRQRTQAQTQAQIANNALYGLDADLIILSMLNRVSVGNVWLFREDVQEGQIVREPSGEEQFVWFNIQELEKTLIPPNSKNKHKWLSRYLFAMTALGNDFLPTGLSLKLREDGHDRLLTALDTVKESGARGLLGFFRNLAADEPMRIQTYILRKISQADSIGVETGLGQKNYPLTTVYTDESNLLSNNRKLRPDWEDVYLAQYFHGATKEEICCEYIRGLRWVWNYYTGEVQSDKWTWMYPWHMPPLWSWLVKYLESYEFSQIVVASAESAAVTLTPMPTPPIPLEQLTLVLPIQSWQLIPCIRHREFAYKCPWYFPEKFGFIPSGRRFFWECEANIPIPTIEEIRQSIADKV